MTTLNGFNSYANPWCSLKQSVAIAQCLRGNSAVGWRRQQSLLIILRWWEWTPREESLRQPGWTIDCCCPHQGGWHGHLDGENSTVAWTGYRPLTTWRKQERKLDEKKTMAAWRRYRPQLTAVRRWRQQLKGRETKQTGGTIDLLSESTYRSWSGHLNGSKTTSIKMAGVDI